MQTCPRRISTRYNNRAGPIHMELLTRKLERDSILFIASKLKPFRNLEP